MSGQWVVYLLRCRDGSIYTGCTNNLDRRIKQHSAGTGAKYTKGRGPFVLLGSIKCLNRGAALSLEAAIKKMPRSRKLGLVKGKG